LGEGVAVLYLGKFADKKKISLLTATALAIFFVCLNSLPGEPRETCGGQ